MHETHKHKKQYRRLHVFTNEQIATKYHLRCLLRNHFLHGYKLRHQLFRINILNAKMYIYAYAREKSLRMHALLIPRNIFTSTNCHILAIICCLSVIK